jgi:methylphosphotriester-DNA--protein-cysteine methyltransferase
MIKHAEISPREFFSLIRDGSIQLAGNRHLKIYGLMNCTSGKRIKKPNRVFFETETEAIRLGFRPCGHCMRERFLQWKHQSALFLS